MSWFVSVVMVVTGLPLGVLVPSVAYASAADAVLTGVPTGKSNVTTLDVTVGSDNGVTHYKSRVVAAADCSGASFVGSGVTIATKIATDISSLADGPVTLCVAGSTDNSSFDTTSPTAVSWTKDTVAPIAVYTPGHSGGIISGDAVAVGVGSKVVLDVGFDEAMGNTAPVVQFKHGSANTNLGSAITSANTQSASVLYDTCVDH